MTHKRVLSVGQCAADHWSLSRTLAARFDAEVIDVRDRREALERIQNESFDLVLVNRIFDADSASGLELIREITGEKGESKPPVMLVSNYEDAQLAAVEAGAMPGFGKAALGQPAMLARLKEFLG